MSDTTSHASLRRLPVHLVGSLPRPLCKDPATAMRWYLSHRGAASLTALPFDRDPRWIIDWLTYDLASVPALEQVRGGDSRGYDDMPYYRVRPGCRLDPADVATGRPAEVAAAFAAVDDMDLPEPLRLQVSVPNAFDLAWFMFGSGEAAQEWLPVVQAAVIGETTEITERWGDRVQLQLETPAVLAAYDSAPREAWPLVTDDLTRQVADVLGAVPAYWVLHLCYGDLEHVPFFTPSSVEPAVVFLNALADLVAERRLTMPTVHLPIAHGSATPSTDPEFFSALRRLRPGVDVIAGVVAEDHPSESRQALERLVEALGRPVVGVAASCGYGRRSVAAATANMALAVRLAHEWESGGAP